MLIGTNVAWSMMAGSVMAWGMIGPTLVHYGVCIGKRPAPDDEHWGLYTSFTSLSKIGQPGNVPSPRYWLLWPGVMIMVCASMAELFIKYKTIWMGLKTAWSASIGGINKQLQKRGKNVPFLVKHSLQEKSEDQAVDIAGPDQQVPMWLWAVGLIVTLAVTMIIGELQWTMNPGMSILACVLGAIFSFLCIQCTGVTDTNPLTAASKASQLVFGGVTSGAGYTVAHAQFLNLTAGGIANGCAAMATDLVGDFRIGFLLRTSPKKQWYAQAVGTFIAMFLAPGMFVLFMAAYPCIVRPEDFDKCPFSVPSVSAWRAVAEAVTNPHLPIQKSSAIFACVAGAVSVIQAGVRHWYLVGSREKYRAYLPSWMAIAISFVVPQTYYSTAALIGAYITFFWKKKSEKSFEVYGYAVAAGLIAGEGLGGFVGACLELGGVSGSVYGTNVGCPMDSC